MKLIRFVLNSTITGVIHATFVQNGYINVTRFIIHGEHRQVDVDRYDRKGVKSY